MRKRLTLKNHQHEVSLFQRRIVLAAIGMIILTILLILRLFQLQIAEHKTYTTLSQQNRLEVVPIAPTRGLIYDRNGVLLAENIPVYSLDVVPARVKHLKQTIHRLQKIISISPRDIKSFTKLAKQHRHFTAIPLKIHLTDAEVAKFAVNEYRFPGIMVKAHLMRHYLQDDNLAHVLGYVGRINALELQHLDLGNYSATNFIGKTGIEKYYENQLHGKVGYEEVEVDATGRAIRTFGKVAPTPGNNLYLTIDSKLQQVAIKALGDHLGAVVVIQPNTGEVLALVSRPGFDPNQFVAGISAKAYKTLRNSPDQPLYNRAIAGQYPFASTVKPFIALQALATHQITPRSKIYDPGWYKLKTSTHTYHDWKRGGHGWVNLAKAIIVSCDTYFFALAHQMGIKQIDLSLQQFGFGQPTQIDLDNEATGLVPSPAWKLAAKGKSWFPGDTLNAGIGQGWMLATPLQLANATAMLANRGSGFQPHLLKSAQPQPEPQVNFPKTVWHTVIAAMYGVVVEPHGTGFRFGYHLPVKAAAKTGTGQVHSIQRRERYDESDIPLKLRDQSLIIAFAPLVDPQIAIAVVVEHSPHVAPVVARKIVKYYFAHKHLSITKNSPVIASAAKQSRCAYQNNISGLLRCARNDKFNKFASGSISHATK